MATFSLTAMPREIMGRKTSQLRAEGKVPSIVYGTGIDPKNITIDRNEFVRLYKEAGESSVINLKVEGGDTLNVLIQDYQQDVLTEFVTHVDFLVIDMNKVIETDVSLTFVGESMAVKSLGGTLVKSMDRLSIKALPKDLVSTIEVDLSSLATFDDAIRVSDLTLPEGVEATEKATRTIAGVAAPRSEAEMEALDEEVAGDIEEVSVEGEKKEDGEKKEAGADSAGKEESKK